MKTKLKIAALAIFIGASLLVFYWQTTAAKAEHVANWGMADAKEININSKVGGRVVEIFADEGESVEQGQLLAQIDTEVQEPQQRQIQATIAAQAAQLEQIIIASRSAEGTLDASLKAAEAQFQRAETAMKLAAKNESRYRELLNAEAISAQTYDVYKTALEDAQAAVDAAAANVESAKVSLLKNEENRAAQLAAREQIDALQSQLEGVNVNIKETEIRAPFAGIITKKYVEAGSLVSTSVPLFSLQDPKDNWVDFKVKETEIDNYKIGDVINLQGRNGELKVAGVVESIRRKADFATQKATSERGDTDIVAFNVKVRTNNKNIWSGMRFVMGN